MTEEQAQLDLSTDQVDALQKIQDWIKGRICHQLTLGGYAGTGKTTLLKQVRKNFDGSTAVMSLTGKAVSVLVKKQVPAATIHSSIYHFSLVNKKPVFYLRAKIEDEPELIIVDEASMVSTDLYDDLLSFDIPILWVGDHGQLEPIGKNPGLMKDPEIKLEKIHRQEEGNPIVAFAEAVRQGEEPKPGLCLQITDPHLVDVDTIKIVQKKDLTTEQLWNADQIICAMNRTRVIFNQYVRKMHELNLKHPEVGDKVICLKNNRIQGVYNGQQGIIKSITPDSIGIYVAEIDIGDPDRNFIGKILKAQFNRVKGLATVPKGVKGVTHWDYGYCITCHKSQGSEWPSVIVVEEPCDLWSMPRWRYTAVTRAEKELIYAV